MSNKTDITGIGWIVDVQKDFMLPPDEGGRLYVQNQEDPEDPGAHVVRPRIYEAVQYLREQGYLLVFTGDWHDFSDPEIDTENPDFVNTYPPHCMGRVDDPELQEGAEILPEIAPEDPLILDVDANSSEGGRVARRAYVENREVWIRKTRFDVFEGNAATVNFLDTLTHYVRKNNTSSQNIAVCGVARDVCVDQAVMGMLFRGFAPTVLTDCIWGLGLEPQEETFGRWRRNGARFHNFSETVG